MQFLSTAFHWDMRYQSTFLSKNKTNNNIEK